MTLNPKVYQESRVEITEHLINEMRNVDITIKLQEKEEDNLMRVVSRKIAQELFEMGFGKR